MKVGSTDVLLDILDTAGHTEYSAMRDQYLRTADVVIILYSITNKQSFENVRQVSRQEQCDIFCAFLGPCLKECLFAIAYSGV